MGKLAGAFGLFGLAANGVQAAAGAIQASAGAFAAPIQAASALNEQVSKAGVVFGQSAARVLEFGNSAAAIGLAKQQADEAAGTFGNLFTSLGLARAKSADMSIATVQLAADLVSFNNTAGGMDQALADLQSGLVGEIEPLRKYGIAINETIVQQEAVRLGLGKNKDALSEAAKVQARYSLILQQSANAQGDFARTLSTSLPNSLRVIQAGLSNFITDLGGQFLPGVQDVVTALASRLPEAIPILLRALQPAADAFNDLAGRIADFVRSDQFPVWVARVGEEISFTVRGLGVLVQAFATAFESIARIVVSVGSIILQAFALINPFVRHSPSLVESVQTGFALIGDSIGTLPARVIPALQAAGAAMSALGAATRDGLARAAQIADAELLKQIALLGAGAVPAYLAARDALRQFNDALKATADAIKEQQAALDKLAAGLKAIQAAQKAAADETKRVGEALRAAGDDLARWSATVLPGTKAFERAMFDSEQAANRLELAIVNLKLSGEIEAAGARVRALQDSLDGARARVDRLRDAWQGAKDQLSAYMNAQLEGTRAFSDASFGNDQEAKRLQLQINQGKLAGQTDEQLKGLVEQLNRVRLAGENIKLEESLQLDPQRRQLEQLGKTTKEMTFAEAVAGTMKWRAEVDRAGNSLAGAERAQRRIAAAVAAAQKAEAAKAAELAALEAQLSKVRLEEERARLERELAVAGDIQAIKEKLDARQEAPAADILAGIDSEQKRVAELDKAYRSAQENEKKLAGDAEHQQALIDAQRDKLDALKQIQSDLSDQAGLYAQQLRAAEQAAGALESALKKAAAAAKGAGGVGVPVPPPLEAPSFPGMPNTGIGTDMGAMDPHEQDAFEKRISSLQILLGQMNQPLRDMATSVEDFAKKWNGDVLPGLTQFRDDFDAKVRSRLDELSNFKIEPPKGVDATAMFAGFFGGAFEGQMRAHQQAWKDLVAVWDALPAWWAGPGMTAVQAIEAFLTGAVVGQVRAHQQLWEDIKDTWGELVTWWGGVGAGLRDGIGNWLEKVVPTQVEAHKRALADIPAAWAAAKAWWDTDGATWRDAIGTYLGTWTTTQVQAHVQTWGTISTAWIALQTWWDGAGATFRGAIDKWLTDAAAGQIRAHVAAWETIQVKWTELVDWWNGAGASWRTSVESWLVTTLPLSITGVVTAFGGLLTFLTGEFARAIDGVINSGPLHAILKVIGDIIDKINSAIRAWERFKSTFGGGGAPEPQGPPADSGGGGGGATTSAARGARASSVTINNTIDARGMTAGQLTQAAGRDLATLARTRLTAGAL